MKIGLSDSILHINFKSFGVTLMLMCLIGAGIYTWKMITLGLHYRPLLAFFGVFMGLAIVGRNSYFRFEPRR